MSADQWTHQGALTNGQPFWFAIKPGTEREIARDGRIWRIAEGVAAFPDSKPLASAATDADAASPATQERWATHGVVDSALPKGERLTTNSPELAETILGLNPANSTGLSYQSQPRIEAPETLSALFGPKSADGLSPSGLALAIALIAFGIWASKRGSRGE